MTDSDLRDPPPIAPEGRRARPDIGPFVAPRTPGEATLAEILRDILEIDRVGMKDGFLALGGDSLTATLLAVQVQDSFGIELDPSTIFDAPDLAALYAAIELSKQGRPSDSAPSPSPQPRPDSIPLSSEQQILLWLHQMTDDKSLYNVPRAMRVRGAAIDPVLLRRCLAALVARHEILRTRVAIVADQPAQIVDAPGEFELEIVDLRETPAALREDQARHQVALFLRRPFAVETDRLFRACLVRLGEDDQILAVAMHHLVSDGGSLIVIFSQLGALYAALSSGGLPALQKSPLQYADYALWQRAAYAHVEDKQVAFWSRYLAGVKATRWLRAIPDPEARSYQTGALSFELSPDLTRRVRDLSRREDVTIAMTLFAANQVILARLCGSDDMVGGMTFSRRTRPEFQEVAGPMLVTYPVRTPITRNGSFRELLAHVKATMLEVYAHLEIDGFALARRMDLQPWPMTNFNLIGDRAGPAKRLEERLRALDPRATVEHFAVPETSGGKAPIDFSIELYDHGDRIAGKLIHGRDIFDTEAIAAVVGDLQTLLARAAENPDRPLSELMAAR